jgi:hypothetical protein
MLDGPRPSSLLNASSSSPQIALAIDCSSCDRSTTATAYSEISTIDHSKSEQTMIDSTSRILVSAIAKWPSPER